MGGRRQKTPGGDLTIRLIAVWLHLEPDLKYGRLYLEMTRQALESGDRCHPPSSAPIAGKTVPRSHAICEFKAAASGPGSPPYRQV
jgi:hypothetical protein